MILGQFVLHTEHILTSKEKVLSDLNYRYMNTYIFRPNSNFLEIVLIPLTLTFQS